MFSATVHRPEPQTFPENTSTKPDRTGTISPDLQHAQVQILGLPARPELWPSQLMALSRHVPLAHALYEHVDWSENLAIAPHHEHQSTYLLCVTSVTSGLCPPSIVARDLHVASTPGPDLCCACTGAAAAADYTPIVGHGKGPWGAIAGIIKRRLRSPSAPYRISFQACFLGSHIAMRTWRVSGVKRPSRYLGFHVSCLLWFVPSRPAGLPG